MGSTPDVPPDDQTPHLRIRFPPSLDHDASPDSFSTNLWSWCCSWRSPDLLPPIPDHVISPVLFYKSHPLVRNNSNHLRGQCMFHQLWQTVFLMWTTCFIISAIKKKERTPFWTEPLTGGSSWAVALPMVHSFNSICNLLGEDAAGTMSWSGRNSMLSCPNWGILWMGMILG